VAAWLRRRGHEATVRPLRVRLSADVRAEYADAGDIECVGLSGTKRRVEVKHRPELAFTSREDFRYDTIIVDVCHAWDNAIPKPYLYVILNASCSHAFVVSGSTWRHWVRRRRLDRHCGRERNFYECPIERTHVVKVD
jgi:hypothetical protein